MKKIVIFSSGTGSDNDLAQLLNILFPDCEILIIPEKSETTTDIDLDVASGALL